MRLDVYQVHKHVPLRHHQQVGIRGAKVDGVGQACVQQQHTTSGLFIEKLGARHTRTIIYQSGLGVTVCVSENASKSQRRKHAMGEEEHAARRIIDYYTNIYYPGGGSAETLTSQTTCEEQNVRLVAAS
jgi:hypothetical protein